jgi:ATP-dependent Lon protease
MTEIINHNNENEIDNRLQTVEIPPELPILALHDTVVYPLTVTPLVITHPRAISLVRDVLTSSSRYVGLFASKHKKVPDPGPTDIHMIGTFAIIHRLSRMSDNSVQLIVQGVDRIHINEFTATDPYLKASVEAAPEQSIKNDEIEARMRNTVELIRRLISLTSHMPNELLSAALAMDDPRQFIYVIATSFRMKLKESQEILETEKLEDKLAKLNLFLGKEVEIIELGKKIQSEANVAIDKNQREYILREQMKQIKKELGEVDELAETIEYERKIVEAGMSAEAMKEATRDLERMKTMPAAAAEYHVIKTWLDWLTDLPWSKSTEDNLDVNRAREILDEDHYDLKEIKERILEYLAVRKLRSERDEKMQSYQGSILCFVGPPGVGKTSLGQSIARALGRQFIRMSLGGMHDEAEIR